jgi:hypothetical protein
MNSELKNSIAKMNKAIDNNTSNEINRLGTVEHSSVSYRRNGSLNHGARQMMAFLETDFYTVGFGGPPIVG